ncbi:hypothetical protein ABW19_dt0205119 [Dactylella cylindrospora]|nr:hypothetical protein ABW19_dt0205119 [Dactylella cylindrospora]
MKGKCTTVTTSNSYLWLFQLALTSTFPALVSAASSEPRQPTAVNGSSLGVQVSTCPFRTANYITHGLPQQCLRASRIVATATGSESGNASVSLDASGVRVEIANGNVESPSLNTDVVDIATTTSIDFVSKFERPPASSPSVDLAHTEDAETPIDTTKFLSFEEWKEQNLAKAGQSAENFGERSPKEARRRPGSMSSALDALGIDSEIDLGFEPEGGDDSGSNILDEAKPSETVEPNKHIRSKDAGKTCKERFNYASFDCAATVHKTNPESKGASAILVENKDSYMLNKCGAKNKFIIVELCDDILVDTVVLANYEFFSSMFRTFRVSVSDRYPVKSAGWKDLGVFEAKNSREIQAFLIENPLIWARYIRIDFLTHYGKEFYCPISLLRIHGTTMMEEFRHQEELARGYNDESEEVEAEAVAEVIEEAAKEEQAIREAEAESKVAAEDVERHSRDMASSQSTTNLPPDVVGPALADPTNAESSTKAESDNTQPSGSEHQEKDITSSSSEQTVSVASTSHQNDDSRATASEGDHSITSLPSPEKSSSKSTSKSSKVGQSDGSQSSHTRETTTSRQSNHTSYADL